MDITSLLTQIADSIRSKDGTTELIHAPDMPQRILDIPTSGSEIVKISSGTFTPSQNVSSVEIEHGLSVTPNFSIVFALVDTPFAVNSYITASCNVDSDRQFNMRTRGSWGNVSCYQKFGEVCDSYNKNTVTFNNVGSNKGDKFVANTTYKWIAGRGA